MSVTPWKVSGSGLRFAREHRQLVDGEGRLPPARLRGPADDSDDVAQVHLDASGPPRVAHELDAPRAVHEVEEDELPHLPSRHDPAGEPALVFQLPAAVERLDLGPDGCYLVAVREALGRGHGARVYAASAAGMIHRTRPSRGVVRTVTTSPCSTASYCAGLTRKALIRVDSPSSTAM